MQPVNKLLPDEAMALSEMLKIFLAQETEEYNAQNREYSSKGDIPSLTLLIDIYIEYLKTLQQYLELTVTAIKKTRRELHNQSDKHKRKFLERLYGGDETGES